ncbi:FxsA family protein [Streptomyces sp. SID8379]|uniref:FxsA family membrane protein n=1 Tax=unclassified Streptomyces TaxID=2593676 RepID=UPI000382A100|nr:MULTISPECIES: FxsA family membrane protein [unclassified Streptomyces]MYW64925.1 FxsA family protein [Streptomyces sp. SID8379]
MTTGTPPSKPAGARRSRARTFLPLAVAAWVVLEIWLSTVVANAIGGFTYFLLMVAGFVLGAVVIKAAGRRAFQNLNETLRRQQQGVVEAGDQPRQGGNGLLLLAGLFLMIPGLITDAFGLLLLVPPVRTALSRYTERTLEKRMSAASPGTLGNAFQQARMHQPGGTVIQGEVIREDEYPGPRRDDADRRPPITP